MDKETLSHYGWSVILVLILSVLLAFASPFGMFIADGFKAAYTGLFDVESSAMDVVMNATGGCTHKETEVTNVTADYSGDTVCKKCGTVLENGKYVVPSGGTYYVGVTSTKTGKYTGATATYTAGQELPETVSDGDVYVYGDYEYRYNNSFHWSEKWENKSSQNGWGVSVLKNNKTNYGEILAAINGCPVNTLSCTFLNCTLLETSPVIPNSITNMYATFRGCSSLKASPIIPYGVVSMDSTFLSCKSITNDGIPVIPNSVTNMYGTFAGCVSVTDFSNFVIPSSIKSIESTFASSGVTNDGLPIIPNTITSIQSAFFNCQNLTDVSNYNIPNSVTMMDSTFKQCYSLEVLPIIPNSVTSLSYTFQDCTSLTDLSNFKIPSSVKYMSQTFMGCTALITAPDMSNATSVTSIDRLFYGCTSLVNLHDFKIPSGVNSLSQTFYNCTSLEVAPSIPDSIVFMSSTFEGCSSLITAPAISNKVSFLTSTFKGCTSLTGTVVINTNISKASNCANCFSGVDFEAQNLTLASNSFAGIDLIGATGTNYCADCNGKCNGGH